MSLQQHCTKCGSRMGSSSAGWYCRFCPNPVLQNTEARSAPEGASPEGLQSLSAIIPELPKAALEGLAPARECWVTFHPNGNPKEVFPEFSPLVPMVRMVPAPVSPSLEAPKAMDKRTNLSEAVWILNHLKEEHYVDEQSPLKSCPKISRGKCNCGADERNEKISRAISFIQKEAPAPAVQGAPTGPCITCGRPTDMFWHFGWQHRECHFGEGAPTEAGPSAAAERDVANKWRVAYQEEYRAHNKTREELASLRSLPLSEGPKADLLPPDYDKQRDPLGRFNA